MSVVPDASARSLARWMTGPSAIGSLNGNSQLEDVGPGFGERGQEPPGRREVRVAGLHEDDERRAPRGLRAPRRPARSRLTA